MHGGKNILVNEPQKKFIIDWCLEKIKDIDFTTAIQYEKNEYGVPKSYSHIYCDYFIRKFDIPVKREVYIGLICFEWHESSSVDFSRLEWIESKVGSEELQKALDEFINNRTLKGDILSNRLNYCIKKGWDIGLSRIIWAMENFGADKAAHYVMVKYMSEFRHLNDLLFLYPKFDQAFKLQLIEAFAKQNFFGVTKYVERDIKRNDENSIQLADQLMVLGSNIALKYYIKWVKKNKKFFKDDSHRQYNVGRSYNVRHLKRLIALMGLTYRYPAKHEFGRSTIEVALTDIAMESLKNVKIVIKQLTSYIKRSKLPNINYLHYYVDQLILRYMQSSNVI